MDNHICKTCQNNFEGSFCNSCGEKVIHHDDRKLKYFLGELINAITFADNKLWRTLKNIVVSPGLYSLNFVEGKRKSYMKPISLFFLANLIYFLIPSFNTFNSNLYYQMNGFWHSDIVSNMINQEVASGNIELKSYSEIYNQKTEELSKLLLIIMAGLLAIFFYPIHIGSKKNLFADHLVMGIESMVFILLFCIIALANFLFLFSLIDIYIATDSNLTLMGFLSLIYFFIRVEHTFYGFRGFRMILNSFLCLVSVALAVSAYRAILFFVTFWSI